MFFKQFYLQGLGHASYLVGSERTGEALRFDPQRQVDGYLRPVLVVARPLVTATEEPRGEASDDPEPLR